MEKQLLQQAHGQFNGVNANGFFIQPKLTINQPNDIYEQEADAMADKVMRMEQPGVQLKPLAISTVQRKCEHCEKEEKKVQRKEINGEEKTAGSNLENYVGSLNSGGQPLPNEVRSFYEPRFGYDFSNVKLHTGTVAAKSAQSINALAYTSGNNIVFNDGQYYPNTDSGKKLLSHELTHVVQQNKTGISKKSIQRLVRTSLVTCGAGQNPFGADRRASAILANAVTAIDAAVAARPATPAAAAVTLVGDAMWRAFRLNAANDANWNDPAPRFGLPLIRRRVAAIQNYIDSVVFTYNCQPLATPFTIAGCAPTSCGANDNAWSCHANATEIDLCPAFWTLDADQRAKTILHETFHIVYTMINDWGGADSVNAHCYSQFIMLLNGLNVPVDRRCH
jgi:Domain of unknown function (DUF4157)